MAAVSIYNFDLVNEYGPVRTVDGLTARRLYQAHVSTLEGAGKALYEFDRNLRLGAPFPDEPTLRVERFDPRQRVKGGGYNSRPSQGQPRRYLFDIAVDYSTRVPDLETDPVSLPPNISSDTLQVTKIVQRDNRGRLITTTAGELITELTEEFHMWRWQIDAQIRTFPPWARDYPGSVNSDTVRIERDSFKPRTLKLAEMRTGPQQQTGRFRHRQLSYALVHNVETWDRFVLNRGFVEIQLRRRMNTTTGRFVYDRFQTPILDSDNQPITEPAFLDRDGRRPLEPNSAGILIPKIRLDPEDIVVLRFETLTKRPYRALPGIR